MDLKKIKSIIDMIKNSNITEFEFSGGDNQEKIRIICANDNTKPSQIDKNHEKTNNCYDQQYDLFSESNKVSSNIANSGELDNIKDNNLYTVDNNPYNATSFTQSAQNTSYQLNNEKISSQQQNEHNIRQITSQLVGTFYASPTPNQAPFVNIDDEISVGQTLCIIEAMKLMNQVDAEFAGKIIKIYAKNGDPIEYGQPLFDVLLV